MKDKKPFEQGPRDGLTPELMERYANGSLSTEMMAKIKHYLDENPFEAEAMEGLIANPVELTKDIQDLDRRLNEKIILDNNSGRKAYWPVAAAVALLIMSGLIFYFFIPDRAENAELAVNEDNMEQVTQPQPEAAITPSIQKTEKIPQNPIINLEDNTATSRREVKEPLQEEEIESVSEVVVEEVKPNENSQKLAFESASTEEEESTSIVSSIEVQPLTKQESTVSDNSQREPVPPQSRFNADEKPQAAAESKAKRSTDPSAGLEIARDLQEDVVFPEGQTPKNIKGYLKEHLIYPEEAKANEITGTVIIVFIIHEDGTLGNFEFLQKLGFGCEEEAVRALKRGPSWKPADINGMAVKSRGQIKITFPQ